MCHVALGVVACEFDHLLLKLVPCFWRFRDARRVQNVLVVKQRERVHRKRQTVNTVARYIAILGLIHHVLAHHLHIVVAQIAQTHGRLGSHNDHFFLFDGSAHLFVGDLDGFGHRLDERKIAFHPCVVHGKHVWATIFGKRAQEFVLVFVVTQFAIVDAHVRMSRAVTVDRLPKRVRIVKHSPHIECHWLKRLFGFLGAAAASESRKNNKNKEQCDQDRNVFVDHTY